MPSFNSLIQPSSTVSPNAPSGFDPAIALVLGNACNLTYMQYATNSSCLSEAQIEKAMGNDGTFEQVGSGFTSSETIGIGDSQGNYRTVPIGFAMKCTPSDGSQSFNVIALRGTLTFAEWIDDADIVPAYWHVGDNNGNYYWNASLKGLGMVHGGFYAAYNIGTDGQEPVKTDHDLDLKFEYSRPEGSVAAAISNVCSELDSSLPLYITGHSLGAGLAVICAMDVGTNFPNCYPEGQLNMWNLAGPLVAAGVNFENTSLSPSVFKKSYGDVVNCSFRIVNTADIVPILPPSSLGMGGLGLEFSHITENDVSYCNQTGSIAGNHSCADNYVAYLEGLAKGYS